jgi:hypothetical protein
MGIKDERAAAWQLREASKQDGREVTDGHLSSLNRVKKDRRIARWCCDFGFVTCHQIVSLQGLESARAIATHDAE